MRPLLCDNLYLYMLDETLLRSICNANHHRKFPLPWYH